ncbi:hypothetical protein [Tabrizicola sp. M-4]|uniref:hypothetical protein n=1 Tax=Tabrizicola sp. M-4 TaxID=3055847 RepID=UPI003DA9AFE1
MELKGLFLLALTLGVGAFVYFVLRREQAVRAARRAGFLSSAEGLFEGRRLQMQPSGFPRLAGWHEGEEFDLQVVADSLTLRKLPALWVLVSIPVPLPTGATVNVMLRPTGLESFSNFGQLPVQIPVPPGFPEDCAIRSDAPGAVPFEAAIREVLGAVDERRLKEILVTPKGVRLVFLAEEAHRGRYLIFRDAEMGRLPLPPARLAPFLAAAKRLRRAVLQETGGKVE